MHTRKEYIEELKTQLDESNRKIDELEKTPIQVTRYARYDESTRPLILVGLVAALKVPSPRAPQQLEQAASGS